jgi:2-iminobutanoate/2-iminopropanoate deaminase
MKNIVNTDKAPSAVGPYNQAITIDKFVFTSGQIPIDPASGELVKGGIKLQTRQVLENLKAVLEASGSALAKVVKVTVYLDDIKNFSQVNEVYQDYFPTEQPARSAVQVAALPLGATIEMDVIAII